MLRIWRPFSTDVLKSPQVTGAGPFVTGIEFKPLSNPSRSVKVDMPRMCLLKLREMCITASNENPRQFLSQQKTIQALNFVELFSEKGASLVLSSSQPTASYHVLRICPSDVWRFPSYNSLIAWTGENPVYDYSSKTFNVKGENQIVVSGWRLLYEIKLKSSEMISVRSDCVVGFNALRHLELKALTPVGDHEDEHSSLLKVLKYRTFIGDLWKAISLKGNSTSSTTFHGPGLILISD